MERKIETICIQDLFYYIDIILISYLLYIALNFLKKESFPNLYIGVIVTLYLNKIQGFFFTMFDKCFDYYKQRTF